MALGDAIAAVGRDLGLPAPGAFDEVVSVWTELVGPDLGAHANVRSVRDGTCTVAVDGPEWATQLRYREADLLRRAEQRCGPGVVRRLHVVVIAPGRTVS